MLPTVSLDSGLMFERQPSLFGNAMTQTLEPRLFYVRTPYKNQNDIPNFDTGVAGFNYAQLFTENRFVGADKVSDANQLTAAIVSRFIDDTGAERLRLAVGSRYYFSDAARAPERRATRPPRPARMRCWQHPAAFPKPGASIAAYNTMRKAAACTARTPACSGSRRR